MFKGNHQRFFLGLLMAVTLSFCAVVIFYSFDIYLHDKKITESAERKELHKKLVSDSEEARKKFSENQTMDLKNEYIESVEKVIKDGESLSQTEKDLLLLKKAVALSIIVRGVPGQGDLSNDMIDSLKILNRLAYLESSKEDDVFIRDYAISAMVNVLTNIHIQCCFDQNISATIFNSKNEEYQNLKTKGYPDVLARFLYVYDLSGKLSSGREHDASTVGQRLLIGSHLLRSETVRLNDTLFSDIKNKMKHDLDHFKDVKPYIFTDAPMAIFEPNLHYAVAFDVFYTIVEKGVGASLQKDVTDKYRNTFAVIDGATKPADLDTANVMKFFTYLAFIESLERRKYDSVLLDKTIDEFVVFITSTPKITSMSEAYFKNAVNSSSSRDAARTLFKLSATHAKLLDYFTSLAIQEKISNTR